MKFSLKMDILNCFKIKVFFLNISQKSERKILLEDLLYLIKFNVFIDVLILSSIQSHDFFVFFLLFFFVLNSDQLQTHHFFIFIIFENKCKDFGSFIQFDNFSN